MKKIIKMIVGVFMVSTAIWAYRNAVEYMYELTFISNMTCGIILFMDGLLELRLKKRMPAIIYQIVLPCINVVFCSCIYTLFGWHEFNFSGAFLFLHAINPPLFLLVYLLCVELKVKNKADYFRRIFIAPVMIMSFILFDYMRYMITGELVYGLIQAERLTPIGAPLFGFGFYLLMVFMSYGLIELKLGVQRMERRGVPIV